MPTGAIADQHGMGVGRDLGADLPQGLVHRLGIGVGHDHGGSDGAVGADGAENVGGDVPVVAHHQRAGADRSPDVGVSALLAHAGLVLEPDFYGATKRGLGERGFDQIGEVFLKAASASGSFFG